MEKKIVLYFLVFFDRNDSQLFGFGVCGNFIENVICRLVQYENSRQLQL